MGGDAIAGLQYSLALQALHVLQAAHKHYGIKIMSAILQPHSPPTTHSFSCARNMREKIQLYEETGRHIKVLLLILHAMPYCMCDHMSYKLLGLFYHLAYAVLD